METPPKGAQARAKKKRSAQEALADAERSSFFDEPARVPSEPVSTPAADGTSQAGAVEKPVTGTAPAEKTGDRAVAQAGAARASREPAAPSPGPPARTWLAGLGQVSQTLLPYWFAASGLALGVGGVVQDKPLAGACGAVAGVTAGLLYQSRARSYQRQAEALRDRLRTQRAESEAASAELRDNLRALRTEIWELKFASQVSTALRAVGLTPGPQAREAAAALATQPLDFGELPASHTAAALEAPATPETPVTSETLASTDETSTDETSADETGPALASTGEVSETEASTSEPAGIEAGTGEVAEPDASTVAATDEAVAEAEPEAEPEDTSPDAEPVAEDDADAEAEAEAEGAQVIDLRAAEVVPAAREGGGPAATTKPASVSAPKKATARTSAAAGSSSGDSDTPGSEPAAEPEPARLSSAS